MTFSWKTLLILSLGILSIIVLYYCYRNFFTKEGFQTLSTEANIVSSDTFVGSTVVPIPYILNGSIITLRRIFDDILNTITNPNSFTGFADMITYSYNSPHYNTFISIIDKPVATGNTNPKQTYWYPYTGQYGSTGNWLTDFSSENPRIIDMDVYNSNIQMYSQFVNAHIGLNKQKFLFQRSLVKPSILYCNIDLAHPPSQFNLQTAYINHTSNTVTYSIAETYITQVQTFDSNTQSWWNNFTKYAKPSQNLYPPSDYPNDTAYHVLYLNGGGDKPPNLTYSNVTTKEAGTIVTLIPDYTSQFNSIQNEQLQLNVYGTLSQQKQNDFQECMFWGGVFANFDDQVSMENVLCVPYNGIIDGSNGYYSFNLFKSDITSSYDTTTKKFSYALNNINISYNSNLISMRSGNSIYPLSDAQMSDPNIITNLTSYKTGTQTSITDLHQAYIGQITPIIMAKVPSLAHQYITSWIYNRSVKYLGMKVYTLTGSGLSQNDLSGANYFNTAVINSQNLTNKNYVQFLNTFTSYTDSTGNNQIIFRNSEV